VVKDAANPQEGIAVLFRVGFELGKGDQLWLAHNDGRRSGGRIQGLKLASAGETTREGQAGQNEDPSGA
jgi:hypothetical protein